jgi:ribonucleoside-diphosphate reductase alpha chain
MQVFVDNQISKTINFPADAEVDDVATAYQLAWQLGCKGITVYVTGSRQKVVLETQATAQSKAKGGDVGSQPDATHLLTQAEQIALWQETKKPRPMSLRGYTFSIGTPLGKAFITINENGNDQPFEVFINTAKAGSDTAAVSEAIGRLISYILRIAAQVPPRERLKEVRRQLAGIGGGRSLGFGPNRVRSLPDGVAQALGQYLELETDVKDLPVEDELANDNGRDGGSYSVVDTTLDDGFHAEQLPLRFGDLCPECGQASVVNEEGCRKCYTCGFSEC